MAEVTLKQYAAESVVKATVAKQLTALGEDVYEIGVRNKRGAWSCAPGRYGKQCTPVNG